MDIYFIFGSIYGQTGKRNWPLGGFAPVRSDSVRLTNGNVGHVG